MVIFLCWFHLLSFLPVITNSSLFYIYIPVDNYETLKTLNTIKPFYMNFRYFCIFYSSTKITHFVYNSKEWHKLIIVKENTKIILLIWYFLDLLSLCNEHLSFCSHFPSFILRNSYLLHFHRNNSLTMYSCSLLNVKIFKTQNYIENYAK